MSKVRKKTENLKDLNIKLFKLTPSLEQVGLREGLEAQLYCFSFISFAVIKQCDKKQFRGQRGLFQPTVPACHCR